ncbi:HAD-IA family hydrolase [Timonella sp. A28]|uniref:HAD-IA family hydrolase n=1 Tax=Timonella sp. A28 TaxID=3442640 RepID=UPI003EBAC90A
MPLSHTGTAFLFDMDGTLVDSTAVVESLWRDFSQQHNLDFVELIDYAHGRQTLDTLHRFMPHSPHATLVELAQNLEAQEQVRSDGIVAVDGAYDFLTAVNEHNIPHALVTSASRDLAIARMSIAGLPLPPVLVTSETTDLGKPHPAPYLEAARQLSVEASTCIAFEDAEAGLASAIASGAATIIVGSHESHSTAHLGRITSYEHTTLRKDGAVITLSLTSL